MERGIGKFEVDGIEISPNISWSWTGVTRKVVDGVPCKVQMGEISIRGDIGLAQKLGKISGEVTKLTNVKLYYGRSGVYLSPDFSTSPPSCIIMKTRIPLSFIVNGKMKKCID